MRVKICGVVRPADARAVGASGADLLGVVLVPGTPRAVAPEEARTLGEAAGLPLVVVVADLTAREAADLARRAGAEVVQLHGSESPEYVRELRGLGAWDVWKVVRPRTAGELAAGLERYGLDADVVLLDRWHPRLLGGTGNRFDWTLMEGLRSAPPGRLGVAGGLTPGNVAEAVRRLRPALVDVSSGVERHPREKDHLKIRAFVEAAREAEARSTAEPERPFESPGGRA